MAALTTRLDTRNFMAGFDLLRQKSKTARGPALARAVGFTLERAKDMTPFATMSKIDTELQVQVEPVLYKNGARAGLQKLGRGKGKEPLTRVAAVPDDSLGARIILARLHRYSSYNVLTDMRYYLDLSSFSPGAGESGFWTMVRAAAAQMIRGRHSSTHFFQQSWNAVIAKLVPYMPEKYRGHFSAVAGSQSAGFAEIGQAEETTTGNLSLLKIENRLGMADQYPTISAIRNAGANKILGPALQSAINEEFKGQVETAYRQGLIGNLSPLKALGFKVV